MLAKQNRLEQELSGIPDLCNENIVNAVAQTGDTQYAEEADKFVTLLPESLTLNLTDLAILEHNAVPLGRQLRRSIGVAIGQSNKQLATIEKWLSEYKSSPSSMAPKVRASDSLSWAVGTSGLVMAVFVLWALSTIDGPVDAFFSILFMIPFAIALGIMSLVFVGPKQKLASLFVRKRNKTAALNEQFHEKVGNKKLLQSGLQTLQSASSI